MASGIISAATSASGSTFALKGPPAAAEARHRHNVAEPEASTIKLVALGAIWAYRTFISPTQGPRCGFYPSCSTFGLQAVREHGLEGVFMTTDRLTRCNLLKGPGPDYYQLPNGKLFDPVSNNLLADP